MAAVGVQELREDASNIVRRVEGGEQIDVTVDGRLAARLVSATLRRWQPWTAVADLFDGRSDTHWESDRDLVDQAPVDPSDHAPAGDR